MNRQRESENASPAAEEGEQYEEERYAQLHEEEQRYSHSPEGGEDQYEKNDAGEMYGHIGHGATEGAAIEELDSQDRSFTMHYNPRRHDSQTFSLLSEKEITERLEQQRREEIENAATKMHTKLLRRGRCPLCTLIPPCHHFPSDSLLPGYDKRDILINSSASPNRKVRTNQVSTRIAAAAASRPVATTAETSRSPRKEVWYSEEYQRTYMENVNYRENQKQTEIIRCANARKFYSNFFREKGKDGLPFATIRENATAGDWAQTILAKQELPRIKLRGRSGERPSQTQQTRVPSMRTKQIHSAARSKGDPFTTTPSRGEPVMHDVSIFTQRSNQEQQHVPSTGMGIRGHVVRIQGKHAGEFEFRNEHSVRTGRGKTRAATS